MQGNHQTVGHAQLRAVRERRLGSAAELAYDLGISPATLSRLLAGKQAPRLKTALLLQERGGIPVADWGRCGFIVAPREPQGDASPDAVTERWLRAVGPEDA